MSKAQKKAYDREYYEKNRKAVQARHHRWHRANREKVTAQAAQYRREHPRTEYFQRYHEKNRKAIVARRRRWRSTHKKQAREYQRKYYHLHAEQCREQQRAYRARHPKSVRVTQRSSRKKRWNCCILESGVHRAKAYGCSIEKFTPKQLKEHARKWNFRCAYCDRRIRFMLTDHVIPLKSGGPHALSNIAPACLHCNRSKCDKPWSAWFQSRPYYAKQREERIKKLLKGESP
jgi:hypothetical protein